MASDHAQVHSCLFPCLGRSSGGDQKRPLSVRIELQHPELLQKLFAEDDGKASLVAHTLAWTRFASVSARLDATVHPARADNGTLLSRILSVTRCRLLNLSSARRTIASQSTSPGMKPLDTTPQCSSDSLHREAQFLESARRRQRRWPPRYATRSLSSSTAR
jgi:hypothetical protein